MQELAPSRFAFDHEGHVRRSPAEPDAQLTRSVGDFGVLFPIHARKADGEILVFDGWRRVQAASEAGVHVPVIIHESVDHGDALAKSLTLNDSTAGVAKQVSDGDRESSLANLGVLLDGDIDEVRYRLGLDGEAEKLAGKIGSVRGVGPSTIASLLDEFGDAESVPIQDAKVLQSAHGVGEKTAGRIARWREHSGASEVVTHDV